MSFKDRAEAAIRGLAENLNGDNTDLFVNTGVRQLESLHSTILSDEQSGEASNKQKVAVILRAPIYPATLLQNKAKLWLNGIHLRLGARRSICHPFHMISSRCYRILCTV